MTRVAGRCRSKGWKKPETVNVNITQYAYDTIAQAEKVNSHLPFYDRLDRVLNNLNREREVYAFEKSEHEGYMELKDIVIRENAETLRLYRAFIQTRGLEEEFKQFKLNLSEIKH